MSRNKKLMDFALAEFLYESEDFLKKKYSEQDVNKILRIRFGVNIFNKNPKIKDAEMIKLFQNNFGISSKAAYVDLKIIKETIGSYNKDNKDYLRHKMNLKLEKAYEIAEKKKDPIAMNKVIDSIAKLNDLHNHDDNVLDPEKVYNVGFLPTNDVTTLGMQKIENVDELRGRLNIRYGILESNSAVQDIDHEDVTDNVHLLVNAEIAKQEKQENNNE